jgi:S-adenosylmethionine decarboxylase
MSENFNSKCENLPCLNYKHALGTEITLDFYECSCDFMSDLDEHKKMFKRATDSANLNIVNECYHQFFPIGLTACAILSESNLNIHTYPEYDYVAINLFYCGKDVIPENCIQEMFDFYNPGRIEIKSFARGIANY